MFRRLFVPGVLLLLLFVLLSNAGRWLVRSDAGRRGELVFLLVGSMGDRCLLAMDLLQANPEAPLLAAHTRDAQRELLARKGLVYASGADLAFALLQQKGVDTQRLIKLPKPAVNTRDEALALAAYLKAHPSVRRVLVVTSSYHTARARYIIGGILRQQGITTELHFPSNPYTQYNAAHWYLHPPDVQATVSEYIKFAVHLAWRQWW